MPSKEPVIPSMLDKADPPVGGVLTETDDSSGSELEESGGR